MEHISRFFSNVRLLSPQPYDYRDPIDLHMASKYCREPNAAQVILEKSTERHPTEPTPIYVDKVLETKKKIASDIDRGFIANSYPVREFQVTDVEMIGPFIQSKQCEQAKQEVLTAMKIAKLSAGIEVSIGQTQWSSMYHRSEYSCTIGVNPYTGEWDYGHYLAGGPN